MTDGAYFTPLGDGRYRATRATESPWSPDEQHGGPPCALLAHAIRALDPVPGLRIARMTVEFLGAIPRDVCRVNARTVRPGKRIRLDEATLEVDGRPVALARAWQIAASGRQPPVAAPVTTELLPPEPQPQRYFPGLDSWGYGESIEWRWSRGSYQPDGPGTVWTRVMLTLIDGEPLHPLDRALLVADSANGISSALPLGEWLYVPPTVTITLHRHPRGEWVCLAAETSFAADGMGSTLGTLGDLDGPIGTVVQPLLVAPR